MADLDAVVDSLERLVAALDRLCRTLAPPPPPVPPTYPTHNGVGYHCPSCGAFVFYGNHHSCSTVLV